MPLPIAGFFASLTFANLVRFLVSAIIVRVLVSIGFAVVIYTGFNIGIDQLETELNNQLNSLGGFAPHVHSIIQKSGLVDYFNIVFSAVGSVFLYKSSANAIKKISLTG